MGVLLSFVVLFSFNFTLAQEDSSKVSWQKTGYSLDRLYDEADFGEEQCLASERAYTACLRALNTLLGSIETKPKEVVFNEALKILEIKEVDLSIKFTDVDEIYASEDLERESFHKAYQLGLSDSFKQIFKTAREIAEAEVSPDALPAAAGSAYGTFLREIYDPRMAFIPKEEQIPKPTNYFGIGAYISKIIDESSEFNQTIAFSPMETSPAEAFGIKKGDILLSVNGVSTKELTPAEAATAIKGPEGTKVELEVHSICENSVRKFEIERGPVTVFPHWVKDSRFVSLEVQDPITEICAKEHKPQAGEIQALYVPLKSFSEAQGQDLCEEFLELQIKDLQNTDSLGMILDLRGNPGGLLRAVACMLDSIIASDAPMIGEIPVNKGVISPSKPKIEFTFELDGPLYNETSQSIHYNKNIIVLVDENSASASEIFAGSIQDMKRGWVVGTRTVGKGTVQTYSPHQARPKWRRNGDEPIMLGSTTAIYTLPSGRSPQQYGVVPDFHFTPEGVEVPYDPNYVTAEEKSFGSLKFENKRWVQNRPDEFAAINECLAQKQMGHKIFTSQLALDQRYGRPFVSSFQLDLAKDILLCSTPREPLLLQ